MRSVMVQLIADEVKKVSFAARETNCTKWNHKSGVVAPHPEAIKKAADIAPKWEGAYNDTHADKDDATRAAAGGLGKIDDGNGVSNKYREAKNQATNVEGCATQATVPMGKGNTRNEVTCTSCKKGYAFVMRFHKARTGRCRKYEHVSRMTTCRLGVNNYGSGPQDKNTGSTKVLLSRNIFSMGYLKGEDVRKHFWMDKPASFDPKKSASSLEAKNVVVLKPGISQRKATKGRWILRAGEHVTVTYVHSDGEINVRDAQGNEHRYFKAEDMALVSKGGKKAKKAAKKAKKKAKKAAKKA